MGVALVSHETGATMFKGTIDFSSPNVYRGKCHAIRYNLFCNSGDYPQDRTQMTLEKMPLVGFGTYQVEKDDADAVIGAALEAGYRHFDCAYIYMNQKEIGDALRKNCARLQIPRSEIFITSKLWNNSHGYEKAMEEAKKTFEQLNWEYVDLYLLHWPITMLEDHNEIVTKETLISTWKAMTELQQAGKVRHIGVSNFSVSMLEFMMRECGCSVPFANQFEMHPFLPCHKLVDFCHSTDIQPIAYCSLGHSKMGLTENQTILSVAKENAMTTSQVLLSWATQRGVAVIPKSSKQERIQENFEISHGNYEARLSDSQMKSINAITERKRLVEPFNYFKVNCFSDPRDYE